MRLPRPRSLFWTLSGAFLAVLVAATVLQGIVVLAVVHPVAERARQDRLRGAAADAARNIVASGAGSPREIARHLGAPPSDPMGGLIVFLAEDGTLVNRWPLPGEMVERLRGVLGEAEIRAVFPETPEGGRPGPGGRPPRGFPGEGPPPAREGGPPGAPAPWREGGTAEILARIPVATEAGLEGEVLAIFRSRGFQLLSPDMPWRILGFLPVAMLLAAGAGMLLFRRLVTRLRRIETLADRVAAGDLSARVEDPGPDEVGRLGERLNRMTGTLAEARERLEAADANRRRLIADISHELGTPLTSIRGYTETLLDPAVPVSDRERAEYLQSVLEESRRLDLLIQELFELTRLEGGAVALQVDRLDWSMLCGNTVERFRPRFVEAGLELTWEPAAAEAWIEADGRRLEQVLENLLTNALRYVPAGGTVEVRLEAGPSPAGEERFRLAVADDGPGIPESDLPHVFERFFRVDAARSTAGTGLGLAIAREIVQRHGGSIRAEARRPAGVRFVVELPA